MRFGKNSCKVQSAQSSILYEILYEKKYRVRLHVFFYLIGVFPPPTILVIYSCHFNVQSGRGLLLDFRSDILCYWVFIVFTSSLHSAGSYWMVLVGVCRVLEGVLGGGECSLLRAPPCFSSISSLLLMVLPESSFLRFYYFSFRILQVWVRYSAVLSRSCLQVIIRSCLQVSFCFYQFRFTCEFGV
jgi:hypothetical protein